MNTSGVGEGLALREGEALGVRLTLFEGLTEADADGERDAVAEGDAEAEAEVDGSRDGVTVADSVDGAVAGREPWAAWRFVVGWTISGSPLPADPPATTATQTTRATRTAAAEPSTRRAKMN
ncbi:hypothetical protein Q0Z83_079200 [Actinoplanes sichuanensis]|nr:hypothetical protein Q0Z83_079200 [Actinoplanes sichuanensis]